MKSIKVNTDLCTGCGLCEMACSFSHGRTFSKAHSRVRVFSEQDVIFPVLSGPCIEEECKSTVRLVVGGHEIDCCSICRASCPRKPIFKEAETAIPLKCDLCGEPPDPHCVKVCPTGALTLDE